ncbi:MAG: hypothetical protein NTX87_05770, partial [Planctomycetota bacterium]|nr:hypothetical protein [Planctomycetota bacterium]
MKTAMRRLQHAEAALSSKQQVLNWLDQALKFGSEERYFQWLRKQPTSELPRIKIINAVTGDVRGRLKGHPPETVARAIRSAKQEVVFLTQLVIDLHLRMKTECDLFDLQAALCARTLQVLVLVCSPVQQREDAWSPEDIEARVLLACNQVQEFLRGVLCLEMTVKTIQDRYFDGRAVVFPHRAAVLATAHETAKVLACEAQAIVAAERGRLSKSAKMEEALVGEEALAK